MSKGVVILGAGASADFGVPTLRSVFKDGRARLYLASDNRLQELLDQIFWQPRGHSLETSEQSLTVEEMLTVLRDWEQEQGLANRPSREMLQDFRRRLYLLIYHAVFEGKSSRGGHLNALIDICRRKLELTTWASFNWDCISRLPSGIRAEAPYPMVGEGIIRALQ